jgi:hypothetical protein
VNAGGGSQFNAVNGQKMHNSSPSNAGNLDDASCQCLNNAINAMQMAAAWGTPDFMGATYGDDFSFFAASSYGHSGTTIGQSTFW